MVDISIFRLVRVVSCLPCHQKGEAVIGTRHGKKAVLGFTYLALLRILHTRIEGDMKRTAILELAQHQLTQKPVLRCEVGVGARCITVWTRKAQDWQGHVILMRGSALRASVPSFLSLLAVFVD